MNFHGARCPVCGAKAYIQKAVVDGFFFGWSVGCSRFCLDDGIHGQSLNTPIEKWYARHNFPDKKTAVKWGNRRATNE